MNESHIIQLDNLHAEHRILKAEYEHLAQRRKRLIKWSLISPLLGIALGAFTMVYFEKPAPQPTVSSPTAVSIDRLADIERRMALLETQKEANASRAEQRVMDMRTALGKLEKLKAKHDGQLSRQGEPLFTLAPPDTAAFVPRVHAPKEKDGYDLDEIRTMAKVLGVSKMVVK